MTKNIVICCDGTDNKFGDRNSNIVRIAQLSIHDNINQIVYYDPGVGTLNLPTDNFIANFWRSKILGQGLGWGLHNNIKEAYKYLMDNFNEGDNVFLFGFSRGAYTVRALAGMLYRFGLLRKGSKNLVPYVSEMYHNYHVIQGIQNIASQFKASFCQECNPHFIGVFDTVSVLGSAYKRKVFADAALNKEIKLAYQAIAIDELRQSFEPFLWDESDKGPDQTIEQVWFIGDHSDIGGGHTVNDLSDISLKWMLQKAEQNNILLKKSWLNTILPNPHGKIHNEYNYWWNLASLFAGFKFGKLKRQIPAGAKIHISVKHRMANSLYSPSLPHDFEFVE